LREAGHGQANGDAAMTYQCPDLAVYAQLWLQFRDAELRAEIVQHRDTCPICISLQEATIERRRSTTADIRGEVSIEFPPGVGPELAGILRRLYRAVLIREGDIGWVYPSTRPDVRRVVGSMGIVEQVIAMAGDPAIA
jgi:hypothetical protein